MDDFEKFLPHVLRYLSYRPRSEHEVKTYLLKKKLSPETIEQILQFLKEKKFLNDSDFVQWWIDQRTRVKPQGKRLIKLELQRKGVSEQVITTILGDTDRKIVGDEELEQLIRKRMQRYTGKSSQELFQKLGQFLLRRGFTYDEIKPTLTRILQKEYNIGTD